MNKYSRCLAAQWWYSHRPGTPYPPLLWSLPPAPGLGTPSPHPVGDMSDKPLFLRGPASLSRSKPDAVSLVPRGPLWVSSARSFRVPSSPFPMLLARSSLSPRLTCSLRSHVTAFWFFPPNIHINTMRYSYISI